MFPVHVHPPYFLSKCFPNAPWPVWLPKGIIHHTDNGALAVQPLVPLSPAAPPRQLTQGNAADQQLRPLEPLHAREPSLLLVVV